MVLVAHNYKDHHRQREYDGTVRDIRVIPPAVPTVHLTTFKKLAVFVSLWFASAMYLLISCIRLKIPVNALDPSEKINENAKIGCRLRNIALSSFIYDSLKVCSQIPGVCNIIFTFALKCTLK